MVDDEVQQEETIATLQRIRRVLDGLHGRGGVVVIDTNEAHSTIDLEVDGHPYRLTLERF